MRKRQREPAAATSTAEKVSTNTGSTASNGASGGPRDIVELLTGLPLAKFLESYHDKESYHHERSDPTFFSPSRTSPGGFPVDWSTERMKEAVAKGTLHYGTDINVVRFDEEFQKRIPMKTSGVVTPEDFDAALKSGWSVRFLRPHEHIPALSAIISEMETLFGCYCGANSYWTPAGSQGFAPHFDDVDVFLLQLEGEKRWRLYEPFSEDDVLARISSEDYVQADLPKPLQDFPLKAGNSLYMPRGAIHQGQTPASTHSLHITFSGFQMHTYADLMKVIVERHIECLARSDLEFRRSLPMHWDQVLGAVNNNKLRHEELEVQPHCGEGSAKRKAMLEGIRKLITATFSTLTHSAEAIDFAVDDFAAAMIAKRQPFPAEAVASDAEGEEEADDATVLKWRLKVRDPHCCRMVLKDSEVDIIHSAENSPICFANPVGTLRFDRAFAPALATLLTNTAANGVLVETLPMPEFEDEDDARSNRATLARALLPSNAFVSVSPIA